MKDSWDDELLSAYLDGEVNADERAHVERALAADPRLRQLHDELRALRQSLQSLPPAKLGDDFTARVVAQAQRALLAQNAVRPSLPEALVEAKAPPQTAGTVRPQETRRPLASRASWRVMVGSVAALAAALLMALMLPDQFNGLARHVVAPQPVDVAMTPDAATSTSIATKSGGAEEAPEFRKDGLAEGDQRRNRTTADIKSAAGEKYAEAPKNDAAADAIATSPAKSGDVAGAAAPVPPPVNLAPETPSRGVPGVVRQSSPLRGGEFTARDPQLDQAEDRIMVVQVAVAPAADRAWKFNETLERNQIAFGASADKTRAKSAVEAEQGRELLPEADASKEVADELTKAAQPFQRRAAGKEVELVLVEATPEQIDATLRDLKAQAGVSLQSSSGALGVILSAAKPGADAFKGGSFRAQAPPGESAENAAGNAAAGKAGEGPQLTPSTKPALPGDTRAGAGGAGGFGGASASRRGGRGGGAAGRGFGGGGFGGGGGLGGREGFAEEKVAPPAPAGTASRAASGPRNEVTTRPRGDTQSGAPTGIARRIDATEFESAKNLPSAVRDQGANDLKQLEKKSEAAGDDRAANDAPRPAAPATASPTGAEAKDAAERRAKKQDSTPRRVRVLFVIQAPPAPAAPPAPEGKPQ